MRQTITYDSLVPGMGFGFSGPRRFLLLPGGVAVGQIVGLDPALGIVHVRTFRPGSDPLRHCPEIGLAPILFSAFRRSVRFLHGTGPVPTDVWPLLTAWRKRNAAHETGAISPVLWRVRDLVWETIQATSPSAHPENTFVEYAFPKREKHSDRYDIVEVSCVPLAEPGTA